MKQILFITAVLAMSSIATASPRITEATFMKKERQDLEAQTERKILEMLEADRLRAENARMETLNGTSFSVQQTPAAPAPHAVQVVPVSSDTTQTW
ncbi:hypothetical protein D3C87_1527250 [compost metagenome]